MIAETGDATATDWVTLTDAARLVNRTRRALERWAAAGLPTVEYRRQQCVQMRHVRDWAREHGRPPRAPRPSGS